MGIFDKLRNKKNVQVETPSATHYDSVSGIPFPAYKGLYVHKLCSCGFPSGVSHYFGIQRHGLQCLVR